MTFESYSDTLTFGNDTFHYSNTRRFDIYISIIDINQVLTDLNDIQSYNNTPFKVYPIPFYTFINIEGDQKIDAVEMYSIDGKLIKTKHSNSFNTLHFPNNLEKGIYFLRIYANPNIFNFKIIK